MLIFVAFAAGRVYTHRAQTRQLVSEIVDLHTSNLAASSPVDVVSSDRHTVKPWFQGKIPFTFNIPELTGTDFSLVGGRLVFLEREPAALLVFKYRGHFLSLFILQDRAPFSRLDERLRLPSSFHVQSWRKDGLRYCLVTDAAAQEAQRLAILLKGAAAQE
jgi:anti-sigma factor RsiW